MLTRTAIRSLVALLLLGGFILVPGGRVLGQEDRAALEWLEQNPDRIGVDAETFKRLFGQFSSVSRPQDVRNDIESFQVFFDRELSRRGQARAEIRVASGSERQEIELSFGGQQVSFRDVGEGADREAGDGVLSAAVPLRLGTLLGERLGGPNQRIDFARPGAERRRFRGREVVGEKVEVPSLDSLDARTRRRLDLIVELGSERLASLNDLRVIRRLELDPEEPLVEFRRAELDPAFAPVFDGTILGFPIGLFGKILPGDVDPATSLMITDLGVVEDPMRTFDMCGPGGAPIGTPGGPWTFAHLMREMAMGSGFSAEDFTLLWLNTWLLPQAANGIVVNDPARAFQLQNRIINPWIAASGGTPDIERFPARLLAIVNRPDLADAVGYGKPGSGGEGRFVFGLLDLSGGGCFTLPFTVIFEYGIDVNGCSDLKGWHQQWKDLDNNPVGSPAYNAALEAITRQFTDHGTNPNQLPNQSSLSQLRTNEIALNAPWELREFTLQGPAGATPGELALVTVKQTPDLGLNNTPTLSVFIASVAGDILADQHVVPNRFPTLLDPFLGANSPTPFAFVWDAPGVLGMPSGVDLRHKFSLATCSGCHAGETGTTFTHIDPRPPGSASNLSGFLTGMSMPDPRDNTVTRTFNDLARRQQSMADILNRTCFGLPFLPLPIVSPH